MERVNPSIPNNSMLPMITTGDKPAPYCSTCAGPLAPGYEGGMCDPCAAAHDASKEPTAKVTKPVHGGYPLPDPAACYICQGAHHSGPPMAIICDACIGEQCNNADEIKLLKADAMLGGCPKCRYPLTYKGCPKCMEREITSLREQLKEAHVASTQRDEANNRIPASILELPERFEKIREECEVLRTKAEANTNRFEMLKLLLAKRGIQG